MPTGRPFQFIQPSMRTPEAVAVGYQNEQQL